MIDNKNLETNENIVETEAYSAEANDTGLTDVEAEPAEPEFAAMNVASEELLADNEISAEKESYEVGVEEFVPEVEAEIVDEMPAEKPVVEVEKSEYDNLVDQFNQIYKSVSDEKKGKGNGKGKNVNKNPLEDIINQAVSGSNEMAKHANKGGGASVGAKSGGMSKGSGTRKGGNGSSMAANRGGGMSKGGGVGRGMGGGKGGGRGKSGTQDMISNVVSGLTKSAGGGKGSGRAGGGKGGSSNLGVDIASTLIKGASKGGGKSSGLGIALSLLSKGMKKR